MIKWTVRGALPGLECGRGCRLVATKVKNTPRFPECVECRRCLFSLGSAPICFQSFLPSIFFTANSSHQGPPTRYFFHWLFCWPALWVRPVIVCGSWEGYLGQGKVYQTVASFRSAALRSLLSLSLVVCPLASCLNLLSLRLPCPSGTPLVTGMSSPTAFYEVEYFVLG